MEMHFGEPPAGEGRQLRLEEIMTALHTVLTIIQVLLAVAMAAVSFRFRSGGAAACFPSTLKGKG